jgi:N-acetylated-alpha-linked acidic dipeptidase
MSLYPGDPLTPEGPATENATRISKDNNPYIPSIPAIPISYSDALPLLQSIFYGIEIQDWKGALEDVKYATGPGPAVARLNIENTREIRPIHNVIGKFPGWDNENEEVLIIGNHRDAVRDFSQRLWNIMILTKYYLVGFWCS